MSRCHTGRPVLLSQLDAPDGSVYASLALDRSGTALLAVVSVDPDANRFRTTQLQSFDVTDRAHPRFVWASENLGEAPLSDGLLIEHDTAFVAARNNGVLIFDVSTPLAPVLEGRIPLPGTAFGVIAGRRALYVAEGAGGVGVISLAGKHHDDCDDD